MRNVTAVVKQHMVMLNVYQHNIKVWSTCDARESWTR